MNLPATLRRLQQAAHDNDRRGILELLAELGRNGGWSHDVSAFINRMSARERAAVRAVMGPPAGDPDGTYVGGGGSVEPGVRVPDPAPPGGPYLVPFAGHSNICGADDYANITNANGYVDPYADVTMSQWITAGSADPIAYTSAGTRGALAPRAAAGQVNFGFELSMGRHLNLVKPLLWFFAKWGIFGSTLAGNWAPDGPYPTSPPAGPNLYHQMITDVLAQLATAKATIPYFILGLGDPDGLDNTMSANFEANLRAFIPRLRADLGLPSLPILLLRTPSTSPIPNLATIRTAQQNVAASVAGVTLIDTDDLTPLITSYHFNANNLVILGNRLATAGLAVMGIPDVTVPVAWTTDGEGVGFPQTAAEWNAVLAAAGVPQLPPFAIPDLTVASGNAPDLLGGVALVASGTNGTYHAAAAGFTRLGISTTDAATFKLATADTSYPDIQSEDMAVLSYVRLNADTGTFRNLTNMGLAAGVRYKAAMKAGGLPNIFEGSTNNTSGTKKPALAVRPMYAQHLASATTAAWADNLEYLTIPFDATVAGKGLEILGGANTAPNAVTLYAAEFRGAAARWSQAQLRAVLKVLRWPVQW